MSNTNQYPKHYTRLDSLPLRNWHELNQSISKGIPEFRWLLKCDADMDFPHIENYQPLYNAYDKICSQLNNIDISIQKAWTEFVILNQRFHLSRLKDFTLQTKITKQDKVNLALHDYLAEYCKRYHKIKIKYYSFVENYNKKWAEITKTKAPGWLNKLKGISFHIPLQYSHYTKGLPDIVNSGTFINQYFEVGYLEFDELTTLNSFFYDYFSEKNDLDNWFDFRQDYFDFRNLRGIYKYNSNYIQEVLMIADALKIPIDVKTVTVAEFEQYLEIIKKKSKK